MGDLRVKSAQTTRTYAATALRRKKRAAESGVAPLLYSRAQACIALGNISEMTLIRLERSGRLKPVRLTQSRSGAVFYKVSDIERLAQGSE